MKRVVLRKSQLGWLLVLMLLGPRKHVAGRQMEKRGVMDNFNDGLKFAGQMFGINTAADVANLVAKAFASPKDSTNDNNNSIDLISTLFQQRRPPAPNRSTQTQQDEESVEHGQDDTQATATNQQANGESSYEQDQQQPHHTKQALPTEEPFLSSSVITNVLRMIGFDARKLGALAINALIMVAQAIGNTLMSATKTQRLVVNTIDGGRTSAEHEAHTEYGGDHQPRQLREGSPIDWLLAETPDGMAEMFDAMTEEKLSDRLTAMIDGMEGAGAKDQQGACLKMLMCKSSPLIWGMQRSVKERLQKRASSQAKPEDNEEKRQHGKDPNSDTDRDTPIFDANVFFTHLPSVQEYRAHGRQCEQRYAGHCNTTRLIHDE